MKLWGGLETVTAAISGAHIGSQKLITHHK